VRFHTISDRSFCVTAGQAWNNLPASVTSVPSLTVLKRRLKTFLFDHSFFVTTYFNYVSCPRSGFAYAALIFMF